MKKYDVIVIGGGHNGLTSACYLSRAGLSVVVLENHPYVGGAAVSRELYPGWTYTNCSYVCSLLRPEIMRDLELNKFGLQVIPYEGSCTMMKSGNYYAHYNDHDKTLKSISRFSQRDAEAYERYSRDVSRQCKIIKPMLKMTPPDPSSFNPKDIYGLLDFAKHFLSKEELGGIGEREIYETMRFWTMSISDYLDEYFETDIVKAHIAGSAIVGTALGPRSPGTAYVLLHHYMGEVDGSIGAWGYSRGGMGSITKAMSNSLKSTGGEVMTDAKVTKLIVKNNKAKGVVLGNGDEIYASNVVSNLDVKNNFLKIVDKQDLPEEFYERVKNFKARGSSGKLNIALDGLPDFPSIPEGDPAREGDLHFSETINELECAYDDWKQGRWSSNPWLDINVPTLNDPTLTSAGKHMMSVFVQYVPYQLTEGKWDENKKKEFGDHVINVIGEHSPNFKDLILHAEIRTPWDIENEVGITEGNIFHGELTMDQLMFNRPLPGYSQYRSPIKGFYMCGSSNHPGGGVMGAPGANAAREVLIDLGKKSKVSY